VDLRAVSAYEAGEYAPSEEALSHIVTALHFPRDFFFGEEIDEPVPSVASFRALSRMTAAQRDMALAQGAIAMYLNRWLDQQFNLPVPDVPHLRVNSPESAADAVRRHWRIGELPIRNMVHLLEAKGVRVFSLAIDAQEVDAFSMWRVDTPFVFLNCNKTSEHSRFDAAHELGHLVLHKHGVPQGREAERQADVFASAFLMPRASVLAHAPRFVTVSELIRLKRIWTVSVAALNYRLHELGITSDWQYRTLCIEIANRGYRKDEPNEAPREVSQVLPKIFSALYAEGMSRARVAGLLAIPRADLEEMMFGLTITALEGGNRDPKSRKIRGLRVVQ
jgi:Zn-dependent peptidase ImmA (M78 family)